MMDSLDKSNLIAAMEKAIAKTTELQERHAIEMAQLKQYMSVLLHRLKVALK